MASWQVPRDVSAQRLEFSQVAVVLPVIALIPVASALLSWARHEAMMASAKGAANTPLTAAWGDWAGVL